MRTIISFIMLSCIVLPCHSAVTMYYDIHNHPAAKSMWLSAAGPYTRIDFTGFAANTVITNQYSSLGVTFTDGTDRIHFAGSYLEDGVGLNGAFDDSRLAFSQPMHALAFDYPGNIKFVLFSGGQAFYDSNIVFGGGAGAFVGITSDQAFDAVQISDPTGGLFYDTLYFAAPVPAPGALALLAAAAITSCRRRQGCA